MENDMEMDLTSMSSTMAYSRLFVLMTEPESYDGCKLKLEGQFLPVKEKGEMQYYCVVTDEAGCCAQAIELIPSQDLRYPDDFPKEKEKCTVRGTVEVCR